MVTSQYFDVFFLWQMEKLSAGLSTEFNLYSPSLQYNIQAYPTTVVFNQSNIHEYEGHHSAEQILEFIEVLKVLACD